MVEYNEMVIANEGYYVEKHRLKEELARIIVADDRYSGDRDPNKPRYYCTECKEGAGRIHEIKHTCEGEVGVRKLSATSYINTNTYMVDVLFIIDDVGEEHFTIIKMVRKIKDKRSKGEKQGVNDFDIESYEEEYEIKGILRYNKTQVEILKRLPSGRYTGCDIKQFYAHKRCDYTSTRVINIEALKNCEYFMERTGYKELITLSPHRDGEIKALLGFIRVRIKENFNAYELIAKAQPRIAQNIESRESAFRLERGETFCGSEIFSRRGGKLKEVLKLTAAQIKKINAIMAEERELGRYGFDTGRVILELEEFQKETGEPLEVDLLEMFYDDFRGARESQKILIGIGKAMEILKHREYKIRQRDIYNYLYYADLNQAIPCTRGIQLWGDYLTMCKQMGVPPKKYPKSLVREHDVLARSYEYVKHKIVEKEFEKRADELTSLEYANKDFIIRVPRTTDEVVEEGKELRHCVASYIKKMSKGSTTIMFLREVGREDKPYITVEYVRGGITQARGYLNSTKIGVKAKRFLEEWLKWLDSREKGVEKASKRM